MIRSRYKAQSTQDVQGQRLPKRCPVDVSMLGGPWELRNTMGKYMGNGWFKHVETSIKHNSYHPEMEKTQFMNDKNDGIKKETLKNGWFRGIPMCGNPLILVWHKKLQNGKLYVRLYKYKKEHNYEDGKLWLIMINDISNYIYIHASCYFCYFAVPNLQTTRSLDQVSGTGTSSRWQNSTRPSELPHVLKKTLAPQSRQTVPTSTRDDDLVISPSKIPIELTFIWSYMYYIHIYILIISYIIYIYILYPHESMESWTPIMIFPWVSGYGFRSRYQPRFLSGWNLKPLRIWPRKVPKPTLGPEQRSAAEIFKDYEFKCLDE